MMKKTCLTLFSLFMASAFSLFSQVSSYLPANKALGPNGTFASVFPTGQNVRYSENGLYQSSWDSGSIGDEYRELLNFRLYSGDQLLFAMDRLPGSDFMISNSGNLAVFDHRYHFNQKLGMHWFNPAGVQVFSRDFSYASFFLFSPSGNSFIACSPSESVLIDLVKATQVTFPGSVQATWSADEKTLLLLDGKGMITLVSNTGTLYIDTGTEFIRKMAASNGAQYVAAIDKKNLIVFEPGNPQPLLIHTLEGDLSYRDLEFAGDKIVCGVHYKKDGLSKGILEVYDLQGNVVHSEPISEKTFHTFPGAKPPVNKGGKLYDPIPWPFQPFNEVHTVWNHYEQHMGDGSSTWSYLHQGLDINVPIGEPAYAVQAGYVKCVLSIGGDYYWRIGISPEQVSGYSDGWLYAHIIQSTIQVAVGDYVDLHDYLGDIIDWGPDWGHIHFVQIRDQGTVWQYDDDEWGINFNPLLALDPITDPVAPVIEFSAPGKKFEFCTNETSTYLDGQNLHGNIDIIVKVSDYYTDSPWEQPAFTTWYTVKRLPENYVVFPKTMGQILNHTYSFYATTWYEEWAPLYYKRDALHPTPYWTDENRDYWHILTNNNGDSIAELSEKQLSFPTQDYNDGDYRIVVEVYDEYGNSGIDSMDVKFINGNTTGIEPGNKAERNWRVFPNPVTENSWLIAINENASKDVREIGLFDSRMYNVRKINEHPGLPAIKLNELLHGLPGGLYFLVVSENENQEVIKLILP